MENLEPVFLNVEAVLELHARVAEEHGFAGGIRDQEGLESALGAVEQCAYYDPEPDVFSIAAAYAFFIAERQAFLDGNKRTAWMAADAFFKLNGVYVHYEQDLVFESMTAIANHRIDRHGLAEVLRDSYTRGV